MVSNGSADTAETGSVVEGGMVSSEQTGKLTVFALPSCCCMHTSREDGCKQVYCKTSKQYLAQREGVQGGKTQEELEAQIGFLGKAPRK